MIPDWNQFPRIGSSHELNDAEQVLARHVARARHQACRDAGISNGRRGPGSDESIDLEGFAAEIAFCQIHNSYPYVEIVTRGPLPDWDVIVADGITVEVKSTTYKTGKLLLPVGKENDSVDVYALMIGSFPGPYYLKGFMGHDELIRPERIAEQRRGQAYEATQQELIDLADWYRLLIEEL